MPGPLGQWRVLPPRALKNPPGTAVPRRVFAP